MSLPQPEEHPAEPEPPGAAHSAVEPGSPAGPGGPPPGPAGEPPPSEPGLDGYQPV